MSTLLRKHVLDYDHQYLIVVGKCSNCIYVLQRDCLCKQIVRSYIKTNLGLWNKDQSHCVNQTNNSYKPRISCKACYCLYMQHIQREIINWRRCLTNKTKHLLWNLTTKCRHSKCDISYYILFCNAYKSFGNYTSTYILNKTGSITRFDQLKPFNNVHTSMSMI